MSVQPAETVFAVEGEGRLVNLACGDGHPIEIMDLSFALQLESALYVNEHGRKLENKLIGANLPLADKDINDLLSEIEIEFDKASAEATKSPMLKKQFLNLVRYSLEQLT